METFIECRNISNYMNQLKTEIDPLKRQMLKRLLAEEEAKLTGHLKEDKQWARG